jgi:hypothetical protein
MRIGLFISSLALSTPSFRKLALQPSSRWSVSGGGWGEGAGCCVSADSLASLRLRMTFWWRLSDRHTSKVPGDRGPCLHVICICRSRFRSRNILLFSVDKIPDFIDLNSFAVQVAKYTVLIPRACPSGINHKLGHGVFARSG